MREEGQVNHEQNKPATMKKRILHEVREILWVSSYLALFFWAFATYKMLILHQFSTALFTYGTALVNALVLSKVILLGKYARVGTKLEDRPLMISAIYKALLFAVLVAIFHFAEELVKRMVHGYGFARAFQKRWDGIVELLILTAVVFCVFIPFFALWETRRMMGDDEFFKLFFRRRAISRSLPR
jgi:hypothetical protein